jgi:hypothetical protein
MGKGLLAGAVAHRSLDGTRFTLTGDLDLSAPFTSVVRVSIDGRLREFCSGALGFGAEWANRLGVAALTEEFRMQGGRLRIWSADRVDHSVQGADARGFAERFTGAVWEGTSYSLFTHLSNATTEDALRIYDAVRITETADGIVIAARPGRASVTDPATVAKDVPGVGLLDMSPLDTQSAKQLPSWSGTRLPGGELYRESLPNNETYFVFVTATAVVTVLPHRATLGDVPRRLGALNVHVAA